MKKKKIRVVELFAGVGGFRLGLEGWNGRLPSSNYKNNFESNFKVVWSNQWEPTTKVQHASDVYVSRFGDGSHSNIDISLVRTQDIPDHDLLVGGFPCQDYSVARVLSQAAGIEGKKGVLWWEIRRIIEEKGNHRPAFVLLENVDRLLKSPANQKGRDFAIMLASLSDLGYVIEWRVINAADYGMPQRRRRTFILAYHKDTVIRKQISEPIDWILNDGVFAKVFNVSSVLVMPFPFPLSGDLAEITKGFNKQNGSISPFHNAGIVIGRDVWTLNTKPKYEGVRKNLGDILQPLSDVPNDFFINGKIEKWEYLKGSKSEPRKKKNGEFFYYKEGALPFPDPLDRPARTIITSEGGKTASRFKHVVSQEGHLRRLTPVELERANMFPDNHTEGVADAKRAFFMGNALVVGVVEKIGMSLVEFLNKD